MSSLLPRVCLSQWSREIWRQITSTCSSISRQNFPPSANTNTNNNNSATSSIDNAINTILADDGPWAASFNNDNYDDLVGYFDFILQCRPLVGIVGAIIVFHGRSREQQQTTTSTWCGDGGGGRIFSWLSSCQHYPERNAITIVIINPSTFNATRSFQHYFYLFGSNMVVSVSVRFRFAQHTETTSLG